MGERMRPADFHAFLDRFYRLASSSIVAHDGIVDKVVGDEVIGLSSPTRSPQPRSAGRLVIVGDSPRCATRQPAIANPKQARHDKKQDQDRHAVQRHSTGAGLAEIKKEVRIPASDPANNQGVEQPQRLARPTPTRQLGH